MKAKQAKEILKQFNKLEENFNDKTQVVQEAKECYYNKFINHIIENI